MATISGNVCNTYIHMDLIVTETGTSVDANTSTLSWKLVGYMGSGGSSSYWYSNSYHAISVVINGSTVYSLANTTQKAISIGTNTSASSPVTIASGTTTVGHNSDGTKSCACSFTVAYRYDSSFTWKGSGNVTLTTIPRTSTISASASSVNFGSSITLNITRASSSFTHTIQYYFAGEKQWKTIATGVGTSYTWTVPTSLMDTIPNSTSGNILFMCCTYNGSTQIGSSATSTITCNVPSSVVPTIDSVTTSDVEGYLAKYGAYVVNQSRCKIDVTSSGAYSSTVSSCKIAMNGYSYDDSSVTFSTLVSGTNTATITVTDSRGRTASTTTSISALAYTKPTISEFTAIRCDADGNTSDSGAYIKASFTSTVTALNDKNSATAVLSYMKTTDTDWTVGGTYTEYTQTPSLIFAADTDASYDVKVTVADDFSSAKGQTITVGTVYVLMDFNESGKGIGIGKVSTADNLDVNMDIIAEDNLYLANNDKQTSQDYYGVVASGAGSTTALTSITSYASAHKSYMGSVSFDGTWRNIISCRHRNGASDGGSYGMVIYSNFGTDETLMWNTQSAGSWGSAKALLDSSNYKSYCGDTYIPKSCHWTTTPNFYATSDTHWVKLGYVTLNQDYDTCTLLVSSAFWGNQHGSEHLLFVRGSTTGGGAFTCKVMSIDSGVRSFKYYKAGNNIYIYMYQTGGNSYATCYITQLQGGAMNFTYEYATNQDVSSAANFSYMTSMCDTLYVAGLQAVSYASTSATISNTSLPTMYLGHYSGYGRAELYGAQVYLYSSSNKAICGNQPYCNLSDARLKNTIEEADSGSKYIELWDAIQPKTFEFNAQEGVEHLGFIAQDFIEKMDELGMDKDETSIVYTNSNEQVGENNQFGSTDEDSEYFDELYMLNYNEIAMMSTLKLKQVVNEIIPEMKAEIEALKAEIRALKGEE